jgi:3-deoxy-D-manno-octulosonic-acid transferase
VALINARLSVRSQRGYRRLQRLIGPALASLSAIAAQTAADGERLQQLGACAISICGNLKFDVDAGSRKAAAGSLVAAGAGHRPVWLAASTREGEEALILDAFAAIACPGLLLLLVPRHPQRFAEVAGTRSPSAA